MDRRFVPRYIDVRNSTLLSVYLGVALGLVHYKWFGGRALHCTVLCRDSAEEDGAAGARDFASGGGRRISFYFLVLTVVPVVRESSDQKAPRVASAAGDVRVPRRVPRTSQLR